MHAEERQLIERTDGGREGAIEPFRQRIKPRIPFRARII